MAAARKAMSLPPRALLSVCKSSRRRKSMSSFALSHNMLVGQPGVCRHSSCESNGTWSRMSPSWCSTQLSSFLTLTHFLLLILWYFLILWGDTGAPLMAKHSIAIYSQFFDQVAVPSAKGSFSDWSWQIIELFRSKFYGHIMTTQQNSSSNFLTRAYDLSCHRFLTGFAVPDVNSFLWNWLQILPEKNLVCFITTAPVGKAFMTYQYCCTQGP